MVYLLVDGNLEEARNMALDLSGKTPSIQSMKSEIIKEMSGVNYQIFSSWKQFNRNTQQNAYKKRCLLTLSNQLKTPY